MQHYTFVSSLLFCIGFLGLCLHRRTLINILMSLELLLLAANLNFIGGAAFWGTVNGHVASLFVLAVSAAEVAIGLAILLVYFKQRKSLYAEDLIDLGNSESL